MNFEKFVEKWISGRFSIRDQDEFERDLAGVIKSSGGTPPEGRDTESLRRGPLHHVDAAVQRPAGPQESEQEEEPATEGPDSQENRVATDEDS